jgi:ankyrin repeat protein
MLSSKINYLDKIAMDAVVISKRKFVDLSNDSTDSDEESSVELNSPPAIIPVREFIFYTFGKSCRVYVFHLKADDDGLFRVPIPQLAQHFNVSDCALMWAGKTYSWEQDLIIDVEELFEIVWQALGSFTIGIYEQRFLDLASQDDATGIATYFEEIRFNRHFRYRSKKGNFNQYRGVSHLELAAFSTNAHVFKALLDYGGYPSVTEFETFYSDSIWFSSDHLRKAAYSAVCIGNVGVVDCLLNRGFNINTDFRGSNSSMFLLACRFHHKFLVEYLLHRDSSLIDKNPSSLHEVVNAYHPDLKIAQILIDFGADVNKKVDGIFVNGKYPIHAAVGGSDNSRNAVQFLVDRGALINACTDLGETPLHVLVRLPFVTAEDCKKSVCMLLYNGVDCRTSTNSGETAYDICMKNGDLDLANLLSDEMSLRESNFGFTK